MRDRSSKGSGGNLLRIHNSSGIVMAMEWTFLLTGLYEVEDTHTQGTSCEQPIYRQNLRKRLININESPVALSVPYNHR